MHKSIDAAMTDTNDDNTTSSLNIIDSRQDGENDDIEEPASSATGEGTQWNIQERMAIPIYQRMPNTAFGIALGLAGYSIVWKTASKTPSFLKEHNIKLAEVLNYIFWVSAIIVGGISAILTVLKWIFSRKFAKDEWKHPHRIHFNNIPHIVLLMLSIGLPSDIEADQIILRSMWGISFVAQIFITRSIYHRWLFSINGTVNSARPQYSLSTVGWLLLSVLGEQTDIRSSVGLNLPTFCFGVGTMFYAIVVFSIFNGLHRSRDEMSSPALFMLLAPPSLAGIALDLMDGDPETFSDGASMLLGWSLIIFVLVIKTAPSVTRMDRTIGTYWAYVFPLSSLATLTIQCAGAERSVSSRVMAIFFMCLATLAVAVVLAHMCWHQILVMRGKERWVDPMFEQCYVHRASSAMEAELEANI